jgi:hypothetical protein
MNLAKNLSRPLKLHLRLIRLRDVTLRVVTLRPQTRARFSTNYFHDTWHVLADMDGAAVFGRLLWGLAFQRHRDTLVLIDRPHLAPTPFDGDPPDPILLMPAGLTRVDVDHLRELRRRLRRAPGPTSTIRWSIFGMSEDLDFSPPRHQRDRLHLHERMSRTAGFICYTAPPAMLRSHGGYIHQMQGSLGNYLPLAECRHYWPSDGEFQLVPHFEDLVSAAVVARREVLGGQDRALASDLEREAVWDRAYTTLRRLHDARR